MSTVEFDRTLLFMTVHGIQLDIAWESPSLNCARVLELLAAAPPKPNSLVVLPELFATGFSMNVELVARAQREAEEFCAELAACFRINLVAGIGAASRKNRAKNFAVAFAPDGKVALRYAKTHPFSFGKENEFYDAGEETVSFSLNDVKVAPLICYDLRFPEAFRAHEEMPELFCVIANWPASRAHHWRSLLVARAIENQAFVVGVNRCGDDPNVSYNGGSLVVGPRGDVLCDAGIEETVFGATLNMEDLRLYRAEFPALKDRK